MYSIIKSLLVSAIVILIAGCASPGGQNLPVPSAAGGEGVSSVLIDSYLIGVGDELKVTVWNNPELSIEAPVRPDGKIAVPLVGDVMAAGLEPELLASNIKQQLSKYVNNPNVTVILTELQSSEFISRIRVTGSVTTNISMPYRMGMTVLDAVLEAGSVTIYAYSNGTKLHRRSGNGTKSYDIRLKDILEDGDMTTNVMLMPGDVITVPESAF